MSFLALAFSGPALKAQAQLHETRQDGYLLRSSTAASDSINPATAANHGIQPTADTAILNVWVLGPGTAQGRVEAVPAQGTASPQLKLGYRDRMWRY